MNLSTKHNENRAAHGFTLVEVLLVIAVISILAAMVVSSFSNAAQSSREVVARQQLAVVQSALNNWVAFNVGKKATESSAAMTVDGLKNYYNTLTAKGRFLLLAGGNHDADTNTPDVPPYLDETTSSHFVQNSPSDMAQIKSNAMVQTSHYLTLPNWSTGAFPTVSFN